MDSPLADFLKGSLRYLLNLFYQVKIEDMPFYDTEHSRQRGSIEKTKSSCRSRRNKETSMSEYFHCKEISSSVYITSIWLLSSKFILCGICAMKVCCVIFQLKNHQCQFNCNEDRLVSKICNCRIEEAAKS